MVRGRILRQKNRGDILLNEDLRMRVGAEMMTIKEE